MRTLFRSVVLGLMIATLLTPRVYGDEAEDLTDEDFSIEVQAWTLAGQAVPGLDGSGVPNQDFAIYVVNAAAVGGTSGGRP